MKKIILSAIFSLLFAFLYNFSNAQDNVSFFLSYGSTCEPVDLSIIDLSSLETPNGGPFYEWYIDGSLISTDPNPASQILNAGDHLIELYISDNDGPIGEYRENFQVNKFIDDFNIFPSDVVCPGQKVILQVDPEPWTVEWDFGDGSLLNGDEKFNNNAQHVYEEQGVYTITLDVENECGFNNFSKEITVAPDAVPDFIPFISGSQEICPNEEIIFGVNEDYDSYLWDFGDGNSSTNRYPVYTYPDQGNASYEVSLTVTNSCGITNTKTIPVNIGLDFPADANFNFTTQTSYSTPCPGTEILFHAFGSGMHKWHFGDGSTSNERDPVYSYSNEGNYVVTHMITSGCGTTDTVQNIITIMTNPEEIADAFFIFDIPTDDYELLYSLDTLRICPNETVKFKNEVYYYDAVEFKWDISDGTRIFGRDAEYLFQNTGTYTVTLSSQTPCGGQSSFFRYVVVDDALAPDASLMVIPETICPNESVYFFDDEFEPGKKIRYHIDFGDGQQMNDIRNITDFELETLASHQYAEGGPYTYTFIAENSCGNTSQITGTIDIDTDQGRTPFYYISNSTSEGGELPPDDWSVRGDETDHQFDLLISWPAWQAEYGEEFHVYFWYGGMNYAEENQPDGYVSFTSSNIISGEPVTAFVPMNENGPNTVGIAAGYYCGGIAKFDEEPEAYGTLLDGDFNLIPEVPLIPSGVTNILDISPGGIVIDPAWDGLCNSDKHEGTWYREVSPGVYAVIEMNEFEGFYNYYMEYRDGINNYTESSYVSSGTYLYPTFPDISQVEWQDPVCGSYVNYGIIRPSQMEIEFTSPGDECVEREAFLSGIFQKSDDRGYDMSVCPGDLVKFQIAGGASYEWDFGDGQTSSEQFPVHAYSEPGTYTATVTATNSCGRQDILTTQVNISSDNVPMADFWIENVDFFRLDSIKFNYGYFSPMSGMIDNNNYSWDFGDGTSSASRSPIHVYTLPGEYKVSLEVSNNCGSNSYEQIIFVREKADLCEAKYSFNVEGNQVNFMDNSTGNPTNWEWDFGNGEFSDEQNPVYIYPSDGIYYAILTIFNDATDCVSSVERRIVVGDVPCEAGFTFLVNNTTGRVAFTNTSQNATNIHWDFGDGRYSNLPNPVHTFNSFGIYPVCATVYNDANGCQATHCEEVFVGPTDTSFIKADFSFFILDDKQTVRFNDLSAGNPTNWYWTTGDGEMFTEPGFEYTYPGPGVYRVCLLVFDEKTGISDEICKEIIIGDFTCKIEADFDFFIDNTDKKVLFKDNSVGNPEFWFWTFGDGGSSESISPKHEYENPGFYLVTLSVFDETNDCMDHTAEFIQVGQVECRAGFEVSVDPVNRKVQFHDMSIGPIEFYYWNFGDGRFSKQKNPVITYSENGIYPVSLTVIDSNQTCLDIAFKEIQVGSVDCSADFEYYIDSLNTTAFFRNRNIGKTTEVLWIFGDGSYSTDLNPKHKFPAPGYYLVSLNTYDLETNCMDYYEEVLLIASAGMDCKSDFIFQPSSDGLTVRFKEKSLGNIQSGVWNFGDGTKSNDRDPIHSYEKSGYYLTCLTVQNNFGIRNMKCKWVPAISENEIDCRTNFFFTVDSANLKVRFSDNSLGDPDTWLWDFGDGNTSTDPNPVHTYSEKGYYRVKLKTSNSISGCKSKEVKLINVAEVYDLKASFDYEAVENTKKVSGYPVDFVGASSGDGASYEWDFGDDQLKAFTVMESSTRIVTHYYENIGFYNACLRVSDPNTGQQDVYCQNVFAGPGVGIVDFNIESHSMSVYPNPANDYTYIKYKLPKDEFIEIAIFDELGRRMETIVRTQKAEGKHEILLDVSKYQAGIYHIKMITNSLTKSSPMVIAR
jgi:PKD repeat protein